MDLKGKQVQKQHMTRLHSKAPPYGFAKLQIIQYNLPKLIAARRSGMSLTAQIFTQLQERQLIQTMLTPSGNPMEALLYYIFNYIGFHLCKGDHFRTPELSSIEIVHSENLVFVGVHIVTKSQLLGLFFFP